MKSWLDWLSECEYYFVRVDDGTANAREYIFENKVRVVKGEKGKGSRGGMVEVDGFRTFHGSVKELTKRIDEVLSK